MAVEAPITGLTRTEIPMVTPGLRPSVLRSLIHRLPFEQHAKARAAAVVDAEKRLLGVVDRADLLHGLVSPLPVRGA